MQQRDTLAGVFLFLVGLTASIQASEFDDASRMFPLIVAGLLAASGFMIAVRSVIKPAFSAGFEHRLAGVIIAVMIFAAWTLALGMGAGFIIPTFIMQLLLLRLTGVRRPATLLGSAATVTTVAYLLFVVLLNSPLPPSRLPAVLQGF